MTISVLTTRTTFEHCLGIIRRASVEILLLLGVHASDGKDPRWFLEHRIRPGLIWAAGASRPAFAP